MTKFDSELRGLLKRQRYEETYVEEFSALVDLCDLEQGGLIMPAATAKINETLE